MSKPLSKIVRWVLVAFAVGLLSCLIIGNRKGIKMEYAEDIKFTNCQINPKPMPIEDYKKIKNVRYNGKDPDAED